MRRAHRPPKGLCAIARALPEIEANKNCLFPVLAAGDLVLVT
jgi:hypothetical protein